MNELATTWAPYFLAKPETGMGFHTGNVRLTDGQYFADVIFTSGCVTKVRGYPSLPFAAKDIGTIEITGNRWSWNE